MPYIWAVLNEAGQVAQTAMDLRPTCDTEAVFTENWKAYLQRTGIPDDKHADGRVLNAGRRPTIVDPQAARLKMRDQFPNISVGYVTRGTAVKDATGKRVPVSWQWLERDSPLPPI